MRLDTFAYLPGEAAGYEAILPYCEIIADRFRVCEDCPDDLRDLAAQYCAAKQEAADIFLGFNALDHSGYPDCRPEYVAAYELMANLATKAGVEGRLRLRIHTPLIEWTKAQIIRRGFELGVDYSLTSSCYEPGPRGQACGECDACLLRLKGFAENGASDPALFQREAQATA